MLIFAAIGTFGLLFLLILLFFGGDHDLHIGDIGGHDVGHDAGAEGGPSPFSNAVMPDLNS
jgi:hypothetical protein